MDYITFKHYVKVGNKKYVHSACFPKNKILEVRNRDGWVTLYIDGYDSSFELAGWFPFYRITRQLKK